MQRMLLLDRYVHLLFYGHTTITDACIKLFTRLNDKALVIDSLLEKSLGNTRFTPTDSVTKIIQKLSENYVGYMRVLSLMRDAIYKEYPILEKTVQDCFAIILNRTTSTKHKHGNTEIEAW